MLELIYNGSEVKFEVSFRTISEHVCEVVGSVPHATTGFTLSRIGKQDGWDYSGYTTIFRELDNGVQYSNDGSVYVPPAPPEEPEPEAPTIEDVKASKTAEIQSMMEADIANGVIYEGECFRYHQNERARYKELLEIAVQSKQAVYVESENGRKSLDGEALRGLYGVLRIHEVDRIAYGEQLKRLVEDEMTIGAVNAISYGQPLAGEYLSRYEEERAAEVGAVEAYVGQLGYATASELLEVKGNVESLNSAFVNKL